MRLFVNTVLTFLVDMGNRNLPQIQKVLTILNSNKLTEVAFQVFSNDKSELSSGTNATLLPLSICVMSLSVDDTARAVKSNNSGCDRVLDDQSPQSESGS